jgi:uncharacterized protein (TIGR02678 family)
VKALTPAEATRVAEKRRAVRALLARPLLLGERDREAFAAVVRHRADLARWFAELPGWSLLVEPASGYARLFKRPARTDPTRPASAPGKAPFDRRRYTLLCLALAALDRAGAQTTLARLAEAVREISLDEAPAELEEPVRPSTGSGRTDRAIAPFDPRPSDGAIASPDPRRTDGAIAPFDPDSAAERHAFVDVLRLLEDLGLIAFRHGDVEGYARAREGADALYDVRERLLGALLSAPLPPALAGTPERMVEEERAQTEEGERLRARQTVFRILLDDPVLYLDDLDPRSREWLGHGSGFAYERLEEDVGLVVERRAEGLAGIDPEGTLSDSTFPEGSSTVKHAALLLCEWLADRARAARAGGAAAGTGTVPWPEVVGRVAACRADCGQAWSKEYGGDDGDERLARDAVATLEAFGLARRSPDGVSARPAAARFAPAPAAR